MADDSTRVVGRRYSVQSHPSHLHCHSRAHTFVPKPPSAARASSLSGQRRLQTRRPKPRQPPTTTNSFITLKNLQKEFFVGMKISAKYCCPISHVIMKPVRVVEMRNDASQAADGNQL